MESLAIDGKCYDPNDAPHPVQKPIRCTCTATASNSPRRTSSITWITVSSCSQGDTKPLPDGRGSVGPELLSRDRKGAVCKGLTPFHQAPPEAQLSRDRERERFAKVSLSRDRKGAVCKDLTEPRP